MAAVDAHDRSPRIGAERRAAHHGWPAPLPAPTRPGLFVCESRNYGYNFCPTGRVSRAQLVRQLSQAQCIEGSTWGVQRDGIWVDRGCEGEFEVLMTR